MHIDLTGQTILVTGAARGIGRALARGLAGSGATVAVHCGRSRSAALALADELGRGAEAFGADLSSLGAIDALWRGVVDRYGRIDAVVHNAGIARALGLDDDRAWRTGWTETMAVNVRAVEALSRHALRHFLAHGGGRLVAITSRAAHRGDTPDYAAYAASKAAAAAYIKSIARGYGKRGVRAFCVSPGFTRTDMAQDFLDAYGEDYATRDIALERLTEPEDLAPLVALLVSGLADHATGTTIDVNAGSYVR